VGKLADEMRDETEEVNRRLRDRTYQLAADPKHVDVPPSPRPPVPYLSLAPLQNAKARVDESAKAFDAAWKARAGGGDRCRWRRRRRSDAVLMSAERTLTRSEGLPRRALVRAPRLRSRLLHRLRGEDAARCARSPRAARVGPGGEQARIVAGLLDGFAAQIDRATAHRLPSMR
jgi:N-acetylated-alpha-linked acidic dipeptidase